MNRKALGFLLTCAGVGVLVAFGVALYGVEKALDKVLP